MSDQGARVWAPQTEISANTQSANQRFIAVESQTSFILTSFLYTPYTGSLQVYKNGLLLTPGVDWIEIRNNKFILTAGATAGDIIVAIANVGITGVAIPIAPTVGAVIGIETLTLAIADTTLIEGSVVNIRYRTGTTGPGTTWDVVLLSTVTPDNIDIYASTGVPTLALVVREDGLIRGDNGDLYRRVSCVIRNDGSGWEALDDSGHKPIGLLSITEDSNFVYINYNFTATKVITTSISADETIGSLDINAGCSVGFSTTTVSIFAPMKFAVNALTGAVVAPSFWGTQITGSTTDNVCTVTHPSKGQNAYGVQCTPETVENFQVSVENAVSTSFDLKSFTECAGLLTASGGGTSWTYSGAMKNAAAASFAANVLTVTHDAIVADFKPQLTPRRSAVGNNFYLPVVEAIATTSFGVFFGDNTFSIVGTADDTMNLSFNRGGVVEASTIKGTYRIDAGMGRINPSDLVSAGGNFWFDGLFKVTSAALVA